MPSKQDDLLAVALRTSQHASKDHLPTAKDGCGWVRCQVSPVRRSEGGPCADLPDARKEMIKVFEEHEIYWKDLSGLSLVQMVEKCTHSRTACWRST